MLVLARLAGAVFRSGQAKHGLICGGPQAGDPAPRARHHAMAMGSEVSAGLSVDVSHLALGSSSKAR